MKPKISAVINTINEQNTIERAIRSLSWVDEVIVCDMHSEDDTAVLAKKLGAKVIFHKRISYVEPARNLAINNASGQWVLILDPDEEVPDTLGEKLREIASHEESVLNFVEIPRKNILFGKWIKRSFWWPDHNIRFFRKGTVTWSNKIHSRPQTTGQGVKLPEEERWAIIHRHYNSISEFVLKIDRYTTVQAKDLIEGGYKFMWKDLLSKPLSEFLSRYFAHRGFEDGVHGLALSLLQAFSFVIVYLKVWEMEGFNSKDIGFKEVKDYSKELGGELHYWFKYGNLSKNPVKRFLQKVKNRF